MKPFTPYNDSHAAKMTWKKSLVNNNATLVTTCGKKLRQTLTTIHMWAIPILCAIHCNLPRNLPNLGKYTIHGA